MELTSFLVQSIVLVYMLIKSSILLRLIIKSLGFK
jgi:hypothetical protein